MACGAASRAARDSLDLHDEPGLALRKSGVVPGFRLRLRGFRSFVARMSEAISGNDGAAAPLLPGSRFAHPGYEENEGSGTPANAGYQPPHLAMRRALFRSAHACRRSTAALTQGSISSQRLSFRPGFLGLGLRGRYPASPVPVQRSTSHPGHVAGRLIPKPPGSELQSRPRAPPSLP